MRFYEENVKAKNHFEQSFIMVLGFFFINLTKIIKKNI